METKYDSLRNTLTDLFGTGDFTLQPVSGGDINRAFKLQVNGQTIFMKANRVENLAFFSAETAELSAIRNTRTVRVPETVEMGRDNQYGAFLLLEWCQGSQNKNFFENFGHNLAAMHKADTSGTIAEYRKSFAGDCAETR